MRPLAHAPEPGGRAAGFTLLELLIAITLMALVAVLLAGGIRLGARVWEVGDARAEAVNRLEVVQSFLRRQISQTVRLRPTGERARYRGVFEGDRSSLRFAVLAPPQFGAGGFTVLTLERRRDGEGGYLNLSARPFHPEMDERPDSGEVRESVLMEGVGDVQLSYYGATRRREAPRWRNEWRNTRELPRLVRLRLTFADERRYWPDLTVAVRASQ